MLYAMLLESEAVKKNFYVQKVSETIDKAKEYFGDKVDFYVEGGEIIGSPSSLIEIKR